MIGETIKGLLSGDSTLVSLVGTNIFPYVADNDTALPCVVYRIDSLTPIYTKAGWEHDEVSFSVYSFAKSYLSLQSIALAVRGALELKNTGAGTQTIGRITIESMEEGYELEADVFFNNLSFQTILKTY